VVSNAEPSFDEAQGLVGSEYVEMQKPNYAGFIRVLCDYTGWLMQEVI
jgi:hypothetical protein